MLSNGIRMVDTKQRERRPKLVGVSQDRYKMTASILCMKLGKRNGINCTYVTRAQFRFEHCTSKPFANARKQGESVIKSRYEVSDVCPKLTFAKRPS